MTTGVKTQRRAKRLVDAIGFVPGQTYIILFDEEWVSDGLKRAVSKYLGERGIEACCVSCQNPTQSIQAMTIRPGDVAVLKRIILESEK